MTRIVVSLAFFAGLSLAVGRLLSGDDRSVDWRLAGGLFAIAVAGEVVRQWLRRSRARSRQSSGI